MKGIAIVAGLMLLTGPVLGLAILTGTQGDAAGSAMTAMALCQSSGPITGLGPSQARNARTIVAVTRQVAVTAGESADAQTDAELIALMTAATESTLHNYANPAVPAGELVPNDGTPPGGGDHDSLGLFQQRPSWGPVSERMTPTASTRLFVTRLLAVPSWHTLPPAVAAQAVQRSAYPDRYAHAQAAALAWLVQITASPASPSCGADGLSSGAVRDIAPGTIPAGYTIPASATDGERRAVTFALAQLGKPYVFGASGPDAYDCSGLTMAAWAAAGVVLPHYTVDQYRMGVPVAATSLLSPGDLIFIPGSDGSLHPPNPQHVGLYLGDDLVIEAPQQNDIIKIVALQRFEPIIGIRHIG